MNPFQSLRDYELLVYTLTQQFPRILGSTLVVAQRGRQVADVNGELTFSDDYRLRVYERLFLSVSMLAIEGYSYEAWRGTDKLYWYDSQPHPHDPTLASTHPHHKHIPPDIRAHRVPAPGLSFSAPNLPFLIQETEGLLPS
jgi:hypothetical protein